MSKFFIKKEGPIYYIYLRRVDKNSDIRIEGLMALTLSDAEVKLKAAPVIHEAQMLAGKVALLDIDVLREAAKSLQSVNHALWFRSKQDWYKPVLTEQVEIDGVLYRPVEFWQ